MSRFVCRLCVLLFTMVSIFSCSYPQPDLTAWNLTPQERDSLNFLAKHHYTYNANFRITADSIALLPNTLAGDTAYVKSGDRVVVADIRRDSTTEAAVEKVVDLEAVPSRPSQKKKETDSVFLKIARDQYTMGWISEKEFLAHSVPSDPISQAIHFFSDSHTYYFSLLLACALLAMGIQRLLRRRTSFIHFYAVNSLYPSLLPMAIATAASVYSGIQRFTPDTWATYYYNPTLNPFQTPLILSLFLSLVWLILILTLTTIDETFRQLKIGDAVSYLFTLAGVCVVAYVFFSLTSLYYIGFPLLPVYYYFSFRYYQRYCGHSYICGNCGRTIRHKGVCPHCGAFNR